MPSHRVASTVVFVLLAGSLGCGARTTLRLGADGGAGPDAAQLDGAPRDAPIDAALPDVATPDAAGRDAFVTGCASDAQCDDGLFCTGIERCDVGVCVAGPPTVCPSDRCRDGLCDERRDLCVVRPSAFSDADRDGFRSIACGGDDCDDADGLVSPMARESCTNGRDDDCNMLTDCTDPVCTGSPACCFRESCTNGVDDDCDGLVDCVDLDCARDPACAVPCETTDLGSVTGFSVARGTTIGQRDDLVGSCGSSNGPDLAFTWTAPVTATFVFDTIDSTYDTVLYIRAGSCAGLELACDDDNGGMLQSEVTLTLRAGTVIVIVVDGFGMSSGDFELNIAPVASEVGRCMDGVDDDADGATDCADMDCAGRPPC